MKIYKHIFLLLVPTVLLSCDIWNLNPPYINSPPVVDEISVGADHVLQGQTIQIEAVVLDEDEDPVSCLWECSAGDLTDSDSDTAEWTAPMSDCTVTITVTASDGINSSDTASKTIVVQGKQTVSGFTGEAGNGVVILKWINPTISSFSGTIIRGSLTSYPNSIHEGELVYEGDGSGYTHAGLSNGTMYYYSIFTKYWNGTYSEKQTCRCSPSDTTYISKPSIPANLEAYAISDNSISLRWESAADADLYSLYQAGSYNGTYTEIYNGSDTSFNQISLSSGTYYYFKVQAHNNAGSSSMSAYISIATIPAAPTGLEGTDNTSSSILMNWNTVTGADNYLLQRALSSSGPFTTIYSGIGTGVTVSGLQADTKYYFRVRASNQSGSSAYSTIDSEYTEPLTSSVFIQVENLFGNNQYISDWSDVKVEFYQKDGSEYDYIGANWLNSSRYCIRNIEYGEYKIRILYYNSNLPYADSIDLTRAEYWGTFSLTADNTNESFSFTRNPTYLAYDEFYSLSYVPTTYFPIDIYNASPDTLISRFGAGYIDAAAGGYYNTCYAFSGYETIYVTTASIPSGFRSIMIFSMVEVQDIDSSSSSWYFSDSSPYSTLYN